MHLNKECIEQEQTKRFFQLSKDAKKGELFGLKNLFNLNLEKNECLTLEILKVCCLERSLKIFIFLNDFFQRYTKIEKGIAGIDVSDFVSPTNVNSSLEQVKESDNEDEDNDDNEYEDDDDDDDEESFETQINKVLSNLKKNNFYFLKELFSIKN